MTSGRGLAGAAVAAMFLLQGCSTLWGGSENKPAAAAPASAKPAASSLASQCGQLQPYGVAAGEDAELPRATFEESVKAAFVKADTDGNGWLTRSELEPVNSARLAMNNGASPIQDWNGDGKVTLEEYAAPSRTMFNMCDRNHDEIVSARELNLNPPRDTTTEHVIMRPTPAPKRTTTGMGGR